jgi:hypothetical protein
MPAEHVRTQIIRHQDKHVGLALSRSKPRHQDYCSQDLRANEPEHDRIMLENDNFRQ